MPDSAYDLLPESPPRLKLVFAKAADFDRVHSSLYSEDARKDIANSNQVIDRPEYTVREAIDGHATFLAEEHAVKDEEPKDVIAATMAYHADALFTEVGSTMVALKGFNAAALIVAALSLREHLRYPYRPQIAAIQSSNAASVNVYREKLGWKCDDANAAYNKEVVGPRPPPTGQKSWFRADSTTYATQARMLLDFIADRGLHNHKTGQFIPVDFSALPEAGLTEEYLQKTAITGVDWRSLMRSVSLKL